MKSYRYLIICACLFAGIANAQKLPNKQQVGLWAPAKVKIDGKSNDWNDQYQAQNAATGLWYTMANDDQNLYLVAYLADPGAIFYKVMSGGITLLIKLPERETSIRYPIFAYNALPSFEKPARGQVLAGNDNDSIVVNNNIILANNAKEIEIKGVKELDTLTSLFNEYGIKAAARFDGKLGYHYELCIPLKYLGLPVVGITSFKYQILLNGGPQKYNVSAANLPRVFSGTLPDGKPMPQAEIDNANSILAANRYARYATTDLSGEYILAIKP